MRDLPNAVTTFDNKIMTRLIEFVILDSGATAHFLVEGEPIINMREAENPITIKLPDRSLIYSTHIGNLDIPWMPDSMIVVHIVPGLSHSSLFLPKYFAMQDAKLCLMSGNAECKYVLQRRSYVC